MPYSQRDWLAIFLKVAILLFLAGSLVYYLYYDQALQEWSVILRDYVQSESVYWGWIVLMLMPFNWSIEALKWHRLVRAVVPLSFGQSIRAVLAGVSFTLFTPNRMGEYAGRILLLKSRYRLRGVVVTLVNSFAQMLTTVGIGLLSLLFWAGRWQGVGVMADILLVVVGMLGLILGLIAYYRLSFWWTWVGKWRPQWTTKRWYRIIAVLQRYPSQEMTLVLLLSLCRYGVYTLQYALLIYWLTGISLPTALLIVPLLFLFQMGFPVPAALEIGVRGSLAANLLVPLGASASAAVVASTTLWAVNLLLPALLGGVIIASLKTKHYVA